MTKRSEAATGHRVSPAYSVIRVGLIHIMAGRGVSTADIAAKLGVNRSYVIRLRGLDMQPQSEEEERIAALVVEFSPALTRLGMGFALKPGFETVLAGGDRSDRIEKGVAGGRPRKDVTADVAALTEASLNSLKESQPKAKRPKVEKIAAPEEKPVGANHKRAAQERAKEKRAKRGRELDASIDTMVAEVETEVAAIKKLTREPVSGNPTPMPGNLPKPKKLGGAERKRLKKQREEMERQHAQAALNLGAPPAPDTIL